MTRQDVASILRLLVTGGLREAPPSWHVEATPSGLVFALLSGWFGIELLREIAGSGRPIGGAASGAVRVLWFGLLAVGCGVIVAGLGRMILGPRPRA